MLASVQEALLLHIQCGVVFVHSQTYTHGGALTHFRRAIYPQGENLSNPSVLDAHKCAFGRKLLPQRRKALKICVWNTPKQWTKHLRVACVYKSHVPRRLYTAVTDELSSRSCARSGTFLYAFVVFLDSKSVNPRHAVDWSSTMTFQTFEVTLQMDAVPNYSRLLDLRFYPCTALYALLYIHLGRWLLREAGKSRLSIALERLFLSPSRARIHTELFTYVLTA